MHSIGASKRQLTISRMTLVSRRSRSCISDCQALRSMECPANPMACNAVVLKLSSSRAGNSVALHRICNCQVLYGIHGCCNSIIPQLSCMRMS